MKIVLAFSILFTAPILSFAQSPASCEQRMAEKIPTPNLGASGTLKEYQQYLRNIHRVVTDCNPADTVSVEVFYTFLEEKLMRLEYEPTYGQVSTIIKEFKNTADYPKALALFDMMPHASKQRDTANFAIVAEMGQKLAWKSERQQRELKKFFLLPENSWMTNWEVLFYFRYPAETVDSKDDEHGIAEEVEPAADTALPVEMVFYRPTCENIDSVFALAEANNSNILLYFTGFGCVNCRKMEESVLSDYDLNVIAGNYFITVVLSTDDKTKLPENRCYISKLSGRKVTTYGQLASDLQREITNTNIQPYFVLTSSNRKAFAQLGYTIDKQEFLDFLSRGY